MQFPLIKFHVLINRNQREKMLVKCCVRFFLFKVSARQLLKLLNDECIESGSVTFISMTVVKKKLTGHYGKANQSLRKLT